MKLKLLFLLMLPLTFFACKKDEVPNATGKLVFHAKVDGQDMVLYNSYTFITGEPFQITKLKFFVTDVTLVAADTEVVIKDYALIDFSNHQAVAATAAEGESIALGDVYAHNYTGIRFNIGVSRPWNDMLPSNFPSASPLADGDNYWDSWDSYIFSKIEGRLDTLGTGTFSFGFSFHIGTSPYLRMKEVTAPIVFADGANTDLHFNVDVKKLFYSATDTLNVRTDYVTHNPDELATRIMDFYPGAIDLQ